MSNSIKNRLKLLFARFLMTFLPALLSLDADIPESFDHSHLPEPADKSGVLPLSKKLNEGAEKIFQKLSKKYNCEFDDHGNIGKRYRRQDEIGTPFCVTYDFESENDGAVTIRDRDTMEQVRVKIDELDAYFADKFTF